VLTCWYDGGVSEKRPQRIVLLSELVLHLLSYTSVNAMSYRTLKSRDTVHIAHCCPSFNVVLLCGVVVRDEPAPEHARQQWSCTACTCKAMCVIILTLTLSQIFIRFAWLISPKSLIHWAAWIELLSDLHQEIWEPPQTCSMYDEYLFSSTCSILYIRVL